MGEGRVVDSSAGKNKRMHATNLDELVHLRLKLDARLPGDHSEWNALDLALLLLLLFLLLLVFLLVALLVILALLGLGLLGCGLLLALAVSGIISLVLRLNMKQQKQNRKTRMCVCGGGGELQRSRGQTCARHNQSAHKSAHQRVNKCSRLHSHTTHPTPHTTHHTFMHPTPHTTHSCTMHALHSQCPSSCRCPLRHQQQACSPPVVGPCQAASRSGPSGTRCHPSAPQP